jgi:DNA-binding transcriptional MerR regulator
MTIFNANLLNWQTIIQHFSETYFSYKDIQLMLQNYVEILKDRVYG